jgi:hypothetical protein
VSYAPPAAPQATAAAEPQAKAPPSWISQFGAAVEDEIGKLKGVAIGTALGLARDLFAQFAPAALRPRIEEAVNRLTARAGGETIPGPILPELFEPAPEAGDGHSARARREFDPWRARSA